PTLPGGIANRVAEVPPEVAKAQAGFGEVPTEVGEAPTEFAVAPTKVAVAPTGVAAVATGVAAAPAKVAAIATLVAVAPTMVGVVPSEIATVPTEVAMAPTEVAVAPTMVGVVPTEIATVPTVVGEVPTVVAMAATLTLAPRRPNGMERVFFVARRLPPDAEIGRGIAAAVRLLSFPAVAPAADRGSLPRECWNPGAYRFRRGTKRCGGRVSRSTRKIDSLTANDNFALAA